MTAAPDTSPPGRFAHVGVLALTVLVFGAGVSVLTRQLRSGLSDQIFRREADKMAAVVSMQLDNSAEELALPRDQVPVALLFAVLKTSKLPGVVGVRVFDSGRHFNSAWPVPWSDEAPASDDWAKLVAGESIARHHAMVSAEEVIGLGSARRGLLEAWVPLRQSGSATMIGAAQFWIEAESAGTELAEHDRRLWTQAGVAWLAGSIIIVLALRWAFRRIDAANQALRARSEDLQRANRELVLAAKTSALGTVMAHLMHELKNPIAGLEMFMAGQADTNARNEHSTGEELAAASTLTRRLRTMVNDVVGVLRDEQSGVEFELTGSEIAATVAEKVRGEAAQRDVKFAVTGRADGAVSGRRANLGVLVVRNLLQNAFEATPAGGVVRLTSGPAAGGGLEFLIEDGGPGLPPSVREKLFQPCTSTKIGGSGLGLALSHQLAQKAGGTLELVRSDGTGTCFRLVLAAEA